MRLRGRVWVVPGVRASRSAEPYSGKATCFADGEPCGSGRESVQPKVVQRGRGRTGISAFFSSTITGGTELEVK